MKSADKDYYLILGVEDCASRSEIEREYKRQAAKHHPDRGGNEEQMKSLNEAYGVLKDESARKTYDDQRSSTPTAAAFVPMSSPTAQDVGVLGHCLSATLCLSAGLFLLLLVRFQWIWFLWPLAILAVFVILFGIVLTRGALRAVDRSLPKSNPFRGHTTVVEVIFWMVLGCGGYAVYCVLAQ